MQFSSIGLGCCLWFGVCFGGVDKRSWAIRLRDPASLVTSPPLGTAEISGCEQVGRMADESTRVCSFLADGERHHVFAILNHGRGRNRIPGVRSNVDHTRTPGFRRRVRVADHGDGVSRVRKAEPLIRCCHGRVEEDDQRAVLEPNPMPGPVPAIPMLREERCRRAITAVSPVKTDRRSSRILSSLDRDRIPHHCGLRARVSVRRGNERVTEQPDGAIIAKRHGQCSIGPEPTWITMKESSASVQGRAGYGSVVGSNGAHESAHAMAAASTASIPAPRPFEPAALSLNRDDLPVLPVTVALRTVPTLQLTKRGPRTPGSRGQERRLRQSNVTEFARFDYILRIGPPWPR
jgi:hypothetical protein